MLFMANLMAQNPFMISIMSLKPPVNFLYDLKTTHQGEK